MRLLKPSVALLFAACFASLWAVAQNTQTTQPVQQTQLAAQSPAQLPQQAPAVTELAPGSSPPAAPEPASGQDRPFRKIIIVPEKPQETPKSPDDRLLMKEAFKVPPEELQRALQEARERERFQARQLLAENASQRDDQPGSFDQGIYLRQIDGANVCGTIVSYHFSPGDDPRLKGVTTCTPWNAVTSKRTNGQSHAPQGPQVIQTVFQKVEK